MSSRSQKNPAPSSEETESLPLYKLVLVGDSGVGKSCLLEKLINSSSKNTFISTIGFVIRTHVLNIQESLVKLQVWDTGGQERYRPVLSTCYRNASGAIIVFDVTNPTSFINLSQWLEEVSEYSDHEIPKILVGNKSDLSDRRKITEGQARDFANKRDMFYIETSALEYINVNEAFTSLIIESKKSQI